MDNMGDWEQKNLISELAQGLELARQLQIHLNVPSSSHEAREFLVEKILSSYEKALSMLNLSSSVSEPQAIGGAIRMSESPPSLTGSPRSEDSDRELKDQEQRDASRKRKTLPRWTRQVRVNPGVGLEGPLDDGFSWRKYGQKDILGAKYPRGYYRCTHRNVQGCLATKQVQRSDEDPNVFEITYRGRHTCAQASATHTVPAPASPEKHEPINSVNPAQLLSHQPQQTQQLSQEMLLNFREALKVQTENLDTAHHYQQPFPSFGFPAAASTSSVKVENQVFPDSLIDNNFVGSISPSFMSPATSGTNYFTVSPTGVNSFGSVHQNLQTSESAATSTKNSPTAALDFPFDQDFDPNFTFGSSGFFP
nr:probable WRKY transcription factor 53 [Quercus suber]POE51203.1 putative wrky transcription factor 41 [Quercus suber]